MIRSTIKAFRKTSIPTSVRALPSLLNNLPKQQVRTAYSEKIIDHYNNPRNVGSLNKNDADVGTGLVGAPACGDVMKLQIRVKDGRIVESVFKTFGCGSAIASSSLATEMLKGKRLEEAQQIKNNDIASYLSLPPVKLHCSMLAEDAIKAAVRDYLAKNPGAQVTVEKVGNVADIDINKANEEEKKAVEEHNQKILEQQQQQQQQQQQAK